MGLCGLEGLYLLFTYLQVALKPKVNFGAYKYLTVSRDLSDDYSAQLFIVG